MSQYACFGSNVIALHEAAASFPMPTSASAGASLEIWTSVGGRPLYVDLTLTADKATTLTGPVGLYGVRGTEKPVLVGELNGGENVVIGGADTGVAFSVLAGAFDRLAIGGVAGATIVPTAGAVVTVAARPIHVTVLQPW